MWNEAMCHEHATCQWWDSLARCVDRGKFPCAMHAATCTSHPQCRLVTGLNGVEHCAHRVDYADHPPCEEILDTSVCAASAGCRFDDIVQRCVDRHTKFNCTGFANDAASCRRDPRCRFVTELNACMNKGEAAPCRLLSLVRCHSTP